jgi:putative acetyltransferase
VAEVADVVRHAIAGDEPRIQELVRSVLSEYDLSFDLDGHDRDLLDIRGSYASRGGCFLVVETEGRVTGCAGLYPRSLDEGELRKMYLSPDARGRGLGRALLHRLIDEARRHELKRLTLESHSSLPAALRLYESAGFTFIPHADPSERADIAMQLLL